MHFVYRSKKSIAAIRLLADLKIPELTKGKTNKLIFLADKLHLVTFGRPITGDWYAAMQHGPVPSHTDNLLDDLENGKRSPDVDLLSTQISLDRHYQYPRITATGESDLPARELSDSDIEAIRETVRHYGSRTFSELRGLTHEMPAYEKAWGARTGNRGEMTFEDLFEEDEDAIAGVMQEAIENCRIRDSFPEPVWD